MALGIRLQFYRQRSNQFTAETTQKPSRSDEREFQAAFNVCGANDFCVIKSFDRLTDLAADKKNDRYAMLFGGRSDIILLPVLPSIDQDTKVEYWQKILSKPHDNSKLLFILRLIVASPLMDQAEGYQDILKTIEAASGFTEQVLTEKCSGIEWSTWTTLGGGSDLIVLALPQPEKTDDLRSLNSAVTCFRSCQITDIHHDKSLPVSHAFSSVQASLCYREHAKVIEALPQNSQQSEDMPQFLVRVTTGVGHESTFLQNMKLQTSPKALQTWGHRSLYIEFDSLRDYLLAVTNAAWDKDTRFLWKHDIDSLRTTISFGPPVEGLDHKPAWKINNHFDRQLNTARASVATFAETFLGASQARRLIQFVDALISAFRKSDRAGSVRDLLPFLFRLADFLNDKSKWKKFFSENVSIFQQYCNEFDRLIGHAWRALRNRVEFRGEPIDPSFPSTLEHGASKLVNAYAVSAWLCWEILRSPNESDHQARCAAEGFAACVAAGATGNVWCEALFGKFHQEYAETFPPLTILSISGKLLFEPEIAFVCCFHEMAEFGSWITIRHNRKLREALNKWAFDAYIRVIVGHFDNWSKKQKSGPLKKETLLQILQILEKLFLAEIPKTDFVMLHPLSFLPKIHARFFEFLVAKKLHKASHGMTTTFGQFTGYCDNYYFDKDSKNSLSDWVKKTELLLKEVIPDIAMVTALWSALDRKTAKEKLSDTERLFQRIIEAARDWFPESSGFKKGIMHSLLRWGIQIAALVDPTDWLSDTRLNKLSEPYWPKNNDYKSLGEFVGIYPEYFPSNDGNIFFTVENSLASVLRQFKNYNDEQSIAEGLSTIAFWQPAAESTAGRLLSIFARMWKSSPSTANEKKSAEHEHRRIEFLLSLWAKAQLLCVDKVFSRS